MPYVYDPIEALDNEFRSYYHADLLTFDWDDPEGLPAQLVGQAASSARRLKMRVGEGGLGDLIGILDEGSESQDTPLVQHLSDITDFEWNEDEFWPTMQMLLRGIAANLSDSGTSADDEVSEAATE